MPLVLDGTNGVSGVDGTASNPAIEGTDSNTGIFYPAADTVAIGTGGTEALRVNSSQNVGIGTSSPTARLTVVTGAAGNNEGEIRLSENATYYAGLRRVNATDEFRIGSYGASQNITFYTVSSERMRLDASGRLGINQTPNANQGMLQVVGAGQSWFRFHDTSAGWNFGTFYRANGTSVLGYLGGGGGNAITGGTADDFVLRSDSALLFAAGGNAERARITSGGYSKASDNGTYYNSTGTFHEFYQSANDTGLAIKAANASYTNNGVLVDISRNTTNNSFYAISYYNAGAAAYKFRVADSGTVTNTTGTYTTISDIKLKQDIVDASSQWDDIKALRIVKYRLKEYVQNDPDSKPFLGLIAQEVEQVSPGLVEEQEDEVMDEDGKLVKNGEVTKGVKTSILYMKAVKALQEAMTRIEALEAKVAALENA